MKTAKILKHWINYFLRYTKGYYTEIAEEHQLDERFNRVYFYHIRKTAGVAIKYAFIHQLGYEDLDKAYKKWYQSTDYQLKGNNKVITGWNIPLINKGNYFFAASHEPAHFLNLPENTFTICCFREPAKRVISQYNQIKGLIKNNIPHPMLKHAAYWVEKDFKTFVDRLPQQILNNQVYMFSKTNNVDEAIENMKRVNFILHTETLADDLSRLSDLLKIELPLQKANSSKHKEELTVAELDYLKLKLKKEYAFYKNIPGNILNEK